MISLAEIRMKLRASGVPPEDMLLKTEYPTPGRFKLQRVVDRAASQCAQPGPLCAWVVRREGRYWDGPGQSWGHDIIAYAVSRDMICWQTGKLEKDL